MHRIAFLLPFLLLAACGSDPGYDPDAPARLDYAWWDEGGLLASDQTVTGAGSFGAYDEASDPLPSYAGSSPSYTVRLENADEDEFSDFGAVEIHLCDDAVGHYDESCASVAIDRWSQDGFRWDTDAGSDLGYVNVTIDGHDDARIRGTISATACAVIDWTSDEGGVYPIYYCYTLSDGAWSVKL